MLLGFSWLLLAAFIVLIAQRGQAAFPLSWCQAELTPLGSATCASGSVNSIGELWQGAANL